MRALLLMLALAATTVGAGEVYRSIAPDGTVVYSDIPEGPNAEPIYIAVPKPASPPSLPAPQPAATSQQPADQQPAAPPADGDAAQKPASGPQATTAEQKAKNCETARKRAESYNAAHRLYRTLPNGEREYLSDSEIDEAKARAAADVETWCK